MPIDAPAATYTIVDGIQESGDFAFLSPLASGAGSQSGEFNPNLAPSIVVCRLDQLGPAGVCDQAPIATLPASSATVGSGQYQFSWDTDGAETGQFNNNRFYRLQVIVGEKVVGSVDLDPQNPNGPGQSTADAYAFRVGETIPVKFWAGLEILCEGYGYVTECITGAIIDQSGADLSLNDGGARLALSVDPNSLPAETPAVSVVLERINAGLFATLNNGEECIPAFDAPQFGECFRITTFPELPPGSLSNPATVSICVDVNAFGLTDQQEGTLNMLRYNDGVYEALADATGDCGLTQTAGLVPVPDGGLLRFAARGINKVAKYLLPQPLTAFREIRLGGLTSSFSRFRFALPGEMIPTSGDGVVIQSTDPNVVNAVVTVVDYEGVAIANAVVHFTTSDGSIDVADVTTGNDGLAAVEWTVYQTPGTKTLVASALGLVEEGGAPDEQANGVIVAEDITFTVTVVGPPASATQFPTVPLSGAAGLPAGDVTITVVDAAGNPISGADVAWTGDGSVAGGKETGVDGSATGTWTLATEPGGNSLTAQIGDVTVTFTAEGTAGDAIQPTYSVTPTSGTAGLTLDDAITVTVTDQFFNPRSGDAVSWTITTGAGSVSTAAGTTGADGVASVNWTLDEAVGINTLLVEVQGFSETFTVEGTVGAAVQPTTSTGSDQTGTVGEALAEPITLLVTDAFGNPIEGAAVTWSTSDGTSASATDATGTASFVWTLGTVAGAQSATGTAAGFAAVTYSAVAEPGEAASLASTGAGVNTLVGATLSDLWIEVRDGFGNPRTGDAVAWAVTSGGGSIAGTSPLAADGSATASWTLGLAPGANAATATVGALSANFTAGAACFDGYGIANIDGTFGAAEWSCAESTTFTASISGGDTPAEIYWMNDADNIYFAIRVQQSSLDKINTLRIDFDNDGDGVAERNDDAIGYDADLGSFFDEYLTQKCENRSQSGCGDADGLSDGSGMVDNDGTWTVFELSHPLNSGQAQDIAAAVGQAFGFYVTLLSGNGAQGNTQFPGFRSYLSFVPVPTNPAQ